MKGSSLNSFRFFYEKVNANESWSFKLSLFSGAKMDIAYSKEMENVYIDGNTAAIQFLSLDIARDYFLINCQTLDDFLKCINKKVIAAGEMFKKTSGEW